MKYSNFETAHFDVRRVVLDWDYINTHDNAAINFFHLWMGFNAWLACVTEKSSDSLMIQCLARDKTAKTAFYDLMQRNNAFAELTNSFSETWPIYDAREVRPLMRENDIYVFENRQSLHDHCNEWGLQGNPREWRAGRPPTWSNCIWAIYQIRCNLLHGQKNIYDPAEIQLIQLAFQTLRDFIEGANCYEWRD